MASILDNVQQIHLTEQVPIVCAVDKLITERASSSVLFLSKIYVFFFLHPKTEWKVLKCNQDFLISRLSQWLKLIPSHAMSDFSLFFPLSLNSG